MEVQKKPILSASQRPPTVKSHVIPAPTNKDPSKGTFLGCCRIDLKRKDCTYEQRQLDVRRIYTDRGRQGSSSDSVKFVTKVMIKKKPPKLLPSKYEQVYDCENCGYLESDSIPGELIETPTEKLSSARKSDQPSSKHEADAIYFLNCQTGLLRDRDEEETRHTRLTERNDESLSPGDTASEVSESDAQDRTCQTGLPPKTYTFPSRYEDTIGNKNGTIGKNDLTGNGGTAKTRQTGFLQESGHSSRKETKTPICVICAVEEIYHNSLQPKSWNRPLINELRDKTGKTSLLTKRLCQSSSRDELSSSSSFVDKIGEACLVSLDAYELNDTSARQSSFSSKSKSTHMDDPADCTRSSSSFCVSSNYPFCYMEELDIPSWKNGKTSQTSRGYYNYRKEPVCKSSQTGFPSKRSLYLPLVNLPDVTSNVESDHSRSDHFPNRLQTPNVREETCIITRSTKVKNEVEIDHLVRSLSKRLTSNSSVKHRPTLFAAPTIGEMNLLSKGPGNDRKNSQRVRAWSVPSVSLPYTMLGQPRCKTVDEGCSSQEDDSETWRGCHSRCSAPISVPY